MTGYFLFPHICHHLYDQHLAKCHQLTVGSSHTPTSQRDVIYICWFDATCCVAWIKWQASSAAHLPDSGNYEMEQHVWVIKHLLQLKVQQEQSLYVSLVNYTIF